MRPHGSLIESDGANNVPHIEVVVVHDVCAINAGHLVNVDNLLS